MIIPTLVHKLRITWLIIDNWVSSVFIQKPVHQGELAPKSFLVISGIYAIRQEGSDYSKNGTWIGRGKEHRREPSKEGLGLVRPHVVLSTYPRTHATLCAMMAPYGKKNHPTR